MRIMASVLNMSFNTEATRKLGVYPDNGLKIRAHKNLTLEKVSRPGDRV